MKDTNGQVVGALWQYDYIVRMVENRPLIFRFSGDFLSLAAGVGNLGALQYESTDCAGEALLEWNLGEQYPLPTQTRDGLDGKFYFGAPPVSTRTVRSTSYVYADVTSQADCSMHLGGSPVFIPPNRCCAPTSGPITAEYVTPGVVDPASFGLVPPFHVEGP